MFDDQNTNQGAGAPPPNLPVDDIFAGTDVVASPVVEPVNLPLAPEPSSPSALSAGVLKPVNAVPTPATFSLPDPSPIRPLTGPEPALKLPSAALPNQNLQDDYTIKEPGIWRAVIMLIIVVFGILLIIFGGWWVYTSFIKGGTDDSFPVNTQTLSPAQNLEQKVETGPVASTLDENLLRQDVAKQPVEDTIDNSVLFGQQVDSDGDGLSDEREKSLGTDPENWDTDGDTLSDFDEVSVWSTDPFNPDTDGDGFFDGAEVKNGYNPSGPGSIFEPPVSNNKTTTTEAGGSVNAGVNNI